MQAKRPASGFITAINDHRTSPTFNTRSFWYHCKRQDS